MPVKLDLGFMTFDLREIPAYARRAEELGVGALWSAETKHDPFLPLAVHHDRGLNAAQVAILRKTLDLDGRRVRQLVAEQAEQFFPQQLRRQEAFVDGGDVIGVMERRPFRQQGHDRGEQIVHLPAFGG